MWSKKNKSKGCALPLQETSKTKKWRQKKEKQCWVHGGWGEMVEEVERGRENRWKDEGRIREENKKRLMWSSLGLRPITPLRLGSLTLIGGPSGCCTQPNNQAATVSSFLPTPPSVVPSCSFLLLSYFSGVFSASQITVFMFYSPITLTLFLSPALIFKWL